MSATETWIVRCDDYTAPRIYKSEEEAKAAIERIEEGGHCRLPHEAVKQ